MRSWCVPACVLVMVAASSIVESSLLLPDFGGLEAEALAQRIRDSLQPLRTDAASTAFWRLASLANVTVQNETISPASPPWLLEAPIALQPVLGILWGGILAADVRVEDALSELNSSERLEARQHYRNVSAAMQQVSIGGGNATLNQTIEAYRNLSAQVDLARMAQAELALLRTAEEAISLLAGVFETLPSACENIQGQFIFQSQDCMVFVGGEGANVYSADSVLIVDFGGNDRYNNNAGGGTLLDDGMLPYAAAMVIDLGNGNDEYDSTGEIALQGGGCMGAGLLIDRGGNDTYRAVSDAACILPIPINVGDVVATLGAEALVTQGSGFFGAGALVDECPQGSMACDDNYTAFDRAQGTGAVGYGLLFDQGGSDAYTIPYTFDSEGGQGVGCYGGFGALVDLGAHGDTHDAYVDDMQGFGCTRALGVLLQEGGDDTYVMRPGDGKIGLGGAETETFESGWGQGMGELGGTGILWDLAGDDYFEVVFDSQEADTGRLSQGAGDVASVGVLLDDDGADVYKSHHEVQGFGNLGAEGLLLDAAGNDQYYAEENCQAGGVAGTFIDVLGFADVYQCGTQAYECTSPLTPIQRGNGRCWVVLLGGLGKDQQ